MFSPYARVASPVTYGSEVLINLSTVLLIFPTQQSGQWYGQVVPVSGNAANVLIGPGHPSRDDLLDYLSRLLAATDTTEA